MIYNPHIHHRRSIRLAGYDYSQAGAYFVTICTQGRSCLFGNIRGGNMILNNEGQMVADAWRWLATRYDYVELDEWTVMPNHIHGIIVITGCWGGSRTCRGGSRTAPTTNPQTIPTNPQTIPTNPQTIPTNPQTTHTNPQTTHTNPQTTHTNPQTIPTNPRTSPTDKRKSLGRLIGAFKTVSTKRINEIRNTPGAKLWQRNYWEHIVRNEQELNQIRAYIRNNPVQWETDRLHPYGGVREPNIKYTGAGDWMV